MGFHKVLNLAIRYFNADIASLSEIAKQNNINDKKYADDEQPIIAFIAKKIEKCIEEFRIFCMTTNSAIIAAIIGTPHKLNLLNIISLNVDNGNQCSQ